MKQVLWNWRKTVLGVVSLVVFLAPCVDAQEDKPFWQWTPDEMKAHVKTVRGGKDLTPQQWPDGAKVAVSISFDFDTEPVWLGFQGNQSPSYMSRGEYGARRGLPRVLQLLDEQQIPATFFIPAASMVLHPDAVKTILDRPQHEIGFHSYIHENPLSLNEAQEREVYKNAMDIFMQTVGKKPVGFRSAAWDLTPATIKIVKEMGFLYDSSMMADDRPYGLISDGEDSGLVELPVEWILDDWPYFQLSWTSHHVGLRTADDVYSIWSEEFNGAYEEGSLYILVTHPQVIGHRYRIQMLERLIEYMKSMPGVWFATHEQIARYVLEQAENSGQEKNSGQPSVVSNQPEEAAHAGTTQAEGQ